MSAGWAVPIICGIVVAIYSGRPRRWQWSDHRRALRRLARDAKERQT